MEKFITHRKYTACFHGLRQRPWQGREDLLSGAVGEVMSGTCDSVGCDQGHRFACGASVRLRPGKQLGHTKWMPRQRQHGVAY